MNKLAMSVPEIAAALGISKPKAYELATCVQGKYKIQGKPDWIEPLNLYSMIVANPAERKSPVMSLLTKCVREYECGANEALAPEISRSQTEYKLLQKELDRLLDGVSRGKETREALLSKQDELSGFQLVKPLRILADDTTPEALISLMADNGGRMSVVSDEGGIFEIINGRYNQGGVNVDAFLKAHDGSDIRVDRKGRESEYINDPCLTILLSVQPHVLNGIMGNEALKGRGLVGRFMYSIPVSAIGERNYETKPIPNDYKKAYRDLCFALLDIKQETPEIIHLSREAHELSKVFFAELEPRLADDLESMGDWAGKLHGRVLRIAGVLHVINQHVFAGKELVPVETMAAAISIGRYFLEHARAAYKLMGVDEAERDARYILEKIAVQCLGKASKTELVRLCRKFKSTEDMTEPLNLLVEHGYIRETELPYSGAGRRPENIYIVNPFLYTA